MKCRYVNLPNGGFQAIVCTSGRERQHRCEICGASAGYQCDWKIGKDATCDRWICSAHAQEVGADKHLCPDHQAAYRTWQARRGASAGG